MDLISFLKGLKEFSSLIKKIILMVENFRDKKLEDKNHKKREARAKFTKELEVAKKTGASDEEIKAIHRRFSNPTK